MERTEEIEGFHHSARGDVYDLYNACNGVMLGDLLDVRKLDELSPEEKRTLNVPRLKEIWAHTASGCLRCKEIIEILNACRGTMRVGNGI
jgi:hypothetical protein